MLKSWAQRSILGTLSNFCLCLLKALRKEGKRKVPRQRYSHRPTYSCHHVLYGLDPASDGISAFHVYSQLSLTYAGPSPRSQYPSVSDNIRERRDYDSSLVSSRNSLEIPSEEIPYGRFQSDVELIKRRLALLILHTEPKCSICGLDNPQLANKDVLDLGGKLNSHMSETLRYSSLRWMDLIAELDDIQAYDEVVVAFLCSPKIIFWIEVLSLLGELDTGRAIVLNCVSHSKDEDRIVRSVTELLKFISEFQPTIALSAPHVYFYALMWLPLNGLVQ
ncbi:hypothetical protein ACEPAF_21 [Sanghuangporus sanghuang]